jgi:predicted SnoaL-like aldol condensation-catalyzing enzyme
VDHKNILKLSLEGLRIEMNMEQIHESGASSLKEMAVSFLKLVVAGDIREAYRTYIGPDFRHHNPYFKGDAESLMSAMEENNVHSPNKTLEVKHVIGEGEFVWVHSHIRQNPEDLGGAAVHIFRFQDGLVSELWDIGMAVPEDSPNENGMF